MELGRLDEETTANVGLIDGGTSGNVVPGHCRIAGGGAQPRRRPRRRGRRADRPTPAPGAPASTAATSTCASKSCFRGYEVPTDLGGARPRRGGTAKRRPRAGAGARSAAAATPTLFRLGGFDCVLLANGTDAVHTADEPVPARPVWSRMLEVCEGIVAAAEASGVSGRLQAAPRGRSLSADPLEVEVDGERRRGLGGHGAARARCRPATRWSSTSPRSTSASAPAASTSSTST